MRLKYSHGNFSYTRALSKPLSVTVFLLVLAPAVSHSEVLFEEFFDDLPDYTSSENFNLPGWDFRRNGEVTWSPENGHTDKHDAFEILAANADKARGGSGKSFVAWRESYDPGWKQWNSDGILVKHFPAGYDQLYVEFYIRFSSSWSDSGASKLFRIFSWNESGSPFSFFSDGNSGPIFIWDYSASAYGARNTHSYRGGPHGENYDFDRENLPGAPRNLVNRGDLPLNFTGDTSGMAEDGGFPKIRDKVNGGFISDDISQIVSREQIYGPGDEWTKVAFFVKMNSSPGVNDGEIMQWLDNVLIYRNDSVSWVDENADNQMVKWNSVAIGGNDFFREYPNSERYEEWYAIDDVMISTSIPDQVGGSFSRPNPPTQLIVE